MIDEQSRPHRDGVLRDVRVVELGTFITGPAAGVLLADLGAEVVKVERPGTGDPFRVGADGSLCGANFQAFNRNKLSIALDTTAANDLARFDALIAQADVFIQNFRPGAAEKLNAGCERLMATNPRLIYCAISGFGAEGPDATRPCYDTVAQAASGYLHLTLAPDDPRVLGPAMADSVTGMYAAYGILGALHERSRTGRGRRVEVSMVGAMAHFNVDAFTHFYSDGERLDAQTRPITSQAHVLTCRDGRRIALHLSSPTKFWENLVRATGHPHLLEAFPTRAVRVARHADVLRALDSVFKAQDLDEWCRRLQAHDVPHSPVYDCGEVLETDLARHLDLKQETPWDGRTFVTVRNPVVYDRGPALPVRPPPSLDAHRAEVLASIGGNSVPSI